MKIISAIYNEQKNAGPKAPADIDKILKDKYKAEKISVVRTGNFRLKLILVFIKLFFYDDWIVLQHPLLLRSFVYNFIPKDKTIILIHDISGLRNNNERILNEEIKIFKKFKYIIVHNDVMKKYLVDKGIDSKNIFVLEIFDYLAKGKIDNKEHKLDGNLSVVYPGNLKKEKSPFIYQLDDRKMNFTLKLYGLGVQEDVSKKIQYCGSFEPADLSIINGDLGLIWDGNFDDSDKNYSFKKYTLYNNPHKLSCCLAIGLPVIVWEETAIANFVKKYNVGYTINNLYDINNLNLKDYDEKRNNAINIGNKLRNGEYTIKVFEEIINSQNKQN
jgi:hypothetical protein